jgi:importin subunit alpha-6/7
MLLREQKLMASLIERAANANFDVKKEALWALSNICTTGTPEHVRCLVEMQGLPPLADVLGLSNADATILGAVLDAVEKILEVGEQFGEQYSALFDECNGIDHLEGLQEHPSNSIYEKTVKIIENYFGNDDFDDENIAPETTAAGTFGFGIEKQLFPAETPITFSFGPATTNI